MKNDKPFNTRDSQHTMDQISRILARQNFESMDEMTEFLKNFTGKTPDQFPTIELTDKEKAEDLIYGAYEIEDDSVFDIINQALALDPDCIPAYETLAAMEETVEGALAQFQKGIDIGNRIYGGEYMKEHVGHFWGLRETRPFMRCLYQKADIKWSLAELDEVNEITEEIIRLNPDDNLGARDLLLLSLLISGEHKKFAFYTEMFIEDGSPFFAFTQCLAAYIALGDCPDSRGLLSAAMELNPHVVPLLVSDTEIDWSPSEYLVGSKEEALYVAEYMQLIWQALPGAVEWLLANQTKGKKGKKRSR